MFLFVLIDSRNSFFLMKYQIHLSPFSFLQCFPDAPRPSIPRPAMSLCRACSPADPALQRSLPCRGHPTICFCASEQYFSQHSHYLPLCVEGFFSDTLDTTRSVYEPILRIWKLFVPRLHQASKCSKSLLKSTQLILKNRASKTRMVKAPAPNPYFIR